MTTVINNPGEGDSSGVGMIVGVLIALLLIGAFFWYGLPAIRNSDAGAKDTTNINVQIPNPAPAE